MRLFVRRSRLLSEINELGAARLLKRKTPRELVPAIAEKAAPDPFDRDQAEERLYRLAVSLDENGYTQAAAAISRYLVGQCNTLEQAFGLEPSQGAPKETETAERDIEILRAKLSGKPMSEIARDFGVDYTVVRRLCGWLGAIDDELGVVKPRTLEEQIKRRLNLNKPFTGHPDYRNRFIAACSRLISDEIERLTKEDAAGDTS